MCLISEKLSSVKKSTYGSKVGNGKKMQRLLFAKSIKGSNKDSRTAELILPGFCVLILTKTL